VAFPHGLAQLQYCEQQGRKKPTFVLPLIMQDHGERPCGHVLDKFVYCGQVVSRKNPIGAVRAFLSSSKLRKQARFVVAGDGPAMEELRSLIAEFDAQEAVILVGVYDTRDLPSILDEKSVFILTSFEDGWSFATLEAVCLGRPLILSNRVGALPDLLVEGVNGYSVTPGDTAAITAAMEKYLSLSTEKVIEMQQTSRKIFEEHNRRERVVSALTAAIGLSGT
jgi:glycosyltransferase involved in cell wall biosynthesis